MKYTSDLWKVALALLLLSLSALVWVGVDIAQENRPNILAATANIKTASWNLSKALFDVQSASALLFQCKGNPACLPSRVMAISTSVMKMAGAWVKVAPEISDSVKGIATNIQAATKESIPAMRAMKKAAEETPGLIRNASGAIVDLNADFKPVLRNASGVLDESRLLIAEFRPQFKLATTHFVSMSDQVNNALPQFTEIGAGIGTNVKGITHSADVFAARFVAPKTTPQKIWEGAKVVIWTVGKALF